MSSSWSRTERIVATVCSKIGVREQWHYLKEFTATVGAFFDTLSYPPPFPLAAKQPCCPPSPAGRRDGDEGFGVCFTCSRLKVVPLVSESN